jgi:hypothetical protein
MNETVFISLFKEVCEKCFGYPLTEPLTETDSKILANRIFEKTGLVIGPKSIKNYSFFVLGKKDFRKENPSDATLDTLARYVLDAPYTDEIQRKRNENHYPYWFRYRSKISSAGPVSPGRKPEKAKKRPVLLVSLLALVILVPVCLIMLRTNQKDSFNDNFNSISEKSLKEQGWITKWEDSTWWNRRTYKPGHMALFTLRGDNWKNAENDPRIHNLVVRKIHSECFTLEVHLSGFIPFKNWQQAGILLSEDSTFTGKMVRLSITYNDFFGGYEKNKTGLQFKNKGAGASVMVRSKNINAGSCLPGPPKADKQLKSFAK